MGIVSNMSAQEVTGAVSKPVTKDWKGVVIPGNIYDLGNTDGISVGANPGITKIMDAIKAGKAKLVDAYPYTYTKNGYMATGYSDQPIDTYVYDVPSNEFIKSSAQKLLLMDGKLYAGGNDWAVSPVMEQVQTGSYVNEDGQVQPTYSQRPTGAYRVRTRADNNVFDEAMFKPDEAGNIVAYSPKTWQTGSNGGGFFGSSFVGGILNDLVSMAKETAPVWMPAVSAGISSALAPASTAATAADIAALADVGMGTNTSLLQQLGTAAGTAGGIEALAPDAGALGAASDLPATGIETLLPDAGSIGAVSDLPPSVVEALQPDAGALGVASDLPPAGIEALAPDAGSLGAASDLPPSGIEALTPDAGSLGAASDLPPTAPVETATPSLPSTPPTPSVPSDYSPVPGTDTGFGAPGTSYQVTPEGIEAIPAGAETSTGLPPTGAVNPDYSPVVQEPSSLPGAEPGAPGTSMTSTPTGAGTAEILDTTGTAAAAASPGFLQSIADATGLPLGAVQGITAALGTSLGIKALNSILPQPTTAGQQISQTPVGVGLAPTYQPYTYKPYAAGGPVEGMSYANAIGANTGFPMANIQKGAYATPFQQPISQNVVTGPQDSRVDPYTGEEKLAGGGISSLGSYSDGGRMLRGPGDGVSDSIPAVIGGKQPARLADGEFVIPARIVSELGNGSTEAGARQLYAMMDRIQAARRKSVGKGKVAVDSKAAKHLPA